MTTIKERLARITIAVGALLLTMSVATPIFGKGSPGLTVRAVVVRGNEVAITVVNRTGETRTGTVDSRVLRSWRDGRDGTVHGRGAQGRDGQDPGPGAGAR
jgi:hypothetical protein